jgi:hypothetical protein
MHTRSYARRWALGVAFAALLLTGIFVGSGLASAAAFYYYIAPGTKSYNEALAHGCSPFAADASTLRGTDGNAIVRCPIWNRWGLS